MSRTITEEVDLAQENFELKALLKGKEIELVALKGSLYKQTERVRELMLQLHSQENAKLQLAVMNIPTQNPTADNVVNNQPNPTRGRPKNGN